MERIFWLVSTIFKIPLLSILFLIYLPINILDLIWVKLVEDKPKGELVTGESY